MRIYPKLTFLGVVSWKYRWLLILDTLEILWQAIRGFHVAGLNASHPPD